MTPTQRLAAINEWTESWIFWFPFLLGFANGFGVAGWILLTLWRKSLDSKNSASGVGSDPKDIRPA